MLTAEVVERCDRCRKNISTEGVWLNADNRQLKFCSNECMTEYMHAIEYESWL
jgi:hypothetical protein